MLVLYVNCHASTIAAADPASSFFCTTCSQKENMQPRQCGKAGTKTHTHTRYLNNDWSGSLQCPLKASDRRIQTSFIYLFIYSSSNSLGLWNSWKWTNNKQIQHKNNTLFYSFTPLFICHKSKALNQWTQCSCSLHLLQTFPTQIQDHKSYDNLITVTMQLIVLWMFWNISE